MLKLNLTPKILQEIVRKDIIPNSESGPRVRIFFSGDPSQILRNASNGFFKYA